MSNKPTFEELEHEIEKLNKALFEKKQDKWSSLVENSPYHIIVIDLDYNIQYTNVTVDGLATENVVGKSMLEFVQPDQHQITLDCFERVIKSCKSDQFENRFITNAGKILWFDVRIVPELNAQGSIINFFCYLKNITREKLANKKLLQSDKKNRLLLSSINDAIVRISTTGKILYASPKVENIGGFLPEEVIGDHFSNYFADEADVLLANKLINSLVEAPEAGTFEFLLKTKTDKPVDIEISFTPILGENNELIEFQLLSRDISEKKKADEQLLNAYNELEKRVDERTKKLTLEVEERKLAEGTLRKRKRQLNSLINATADFAFLISSNGTFLATNETLANRLGMNKEELIGKTVFDFPLIFNESRLDLLPTINSTKNPVQWNDERDGRFFEHSAFPILDDNGDVIQIGGFSRDITDYKKTEDALKKSIAFLKSSIESPSGMIILGIDTDYKYLFFNKRHKKGMLDAYGKEIAIGMSILDSITADQDRGAAKKDFDLALAGNSITSIHEYGANFQAYYETVYGPIVDENDEIIGVSAFSSDITERMQAENDLKKAHDKLEVNVEEQTMELEFESIKYRALVEDMPALNCRFNPDGELTFVDNDFCKYFNKTQESLIGNYFFKLFSKENQKHIINHYKSLNKQNPVVSYDQKVASDHGEVRWQQWTHRALFNKEDNLIEYQSMGVDTTDHHLTQQKSEEKAIEFQELNAALNVLLKKRQQDKEKFEEDILSSIRILIKPLIAKLKNSNLPKNQTNILGILESNLNEIISPFTRKLSSKYYNLSPTEIQIANLIKHGKTSKEISEISGVTTRTIEFHRENIRKKLDLTNKKTNLKTYLLSSE